MKILFLTPQLPFPPHQGTSIRNFNLIRHLAPEHRISLLSFVADERELEGAVPLRKLCQRIEVVPVPPPRSAVARATATLFSPWPDLALRLRSRDYSAPTRGCR